MTVLGVSAVTLEVPDLEVGIEFYTNAGLLVSRDGNRAYLSCAGQDRPSIVLIGGAISKRLHHLRLRADPTEFEQTRARIALHGGQVIDAPEGFEAAGIWLLDPHGMCIHLADEPADRPLQEAAPFEINAPGRVVRTRRSAVLPATAYAPVRPLRMGHVLVFTPSVSRSIAFLTDALGMGLADRSEENLAFMCCRKQSDHHVVGLGRSAGVGFQHASFQVNDPDEVGRAGQALRRKSTGIDWGLGRHTIGSNFFHYIQDPWGSWFEYYSDIDYIDDYEKWTPTNYAPEDSLASWGPEAPRAFIENREVSEQ